MAGEDGALFLTTDGVSGIFDWHEDEVFASPELAAAAWERVRVRTWNHEFREEVFPPAGAVYDGLASRTEACGYTPPKERVLEAVEADLAAVEAFRVDRPDAAASIADPLAVYENALHLIAGAFAKGSTQDSRREIWQKITQPGVSHGEVA